MWTETAPLTSFVKNMAYDFMLVRKAEEDLEAIVSHLAIQLCNPQAAANFLAQLQASIEEACLFPESGRLVDNEFLPVQTIRKKLVSSYVLYYLPDSDANRIYVLRIVYGRRNLEEVLRDIQE